METRAPKSDNTSSDLVIVMDYSSSKPKFDEKTFDDFGGGVNPLGYMGHSFTGHGFGPVYPRNCTPRSFRANGGFSPNSIPTTTTPTATSVGPAEAFTTPTVQNPLKSPSSSLCTIPINDEKHQQNLSSKSGQEKENRQRGLLTRTVRERISGESGGDNNDHNRGLLLPVRVTPIQLIMKSCLCTLSFIVLVLNLFASKSVVYIAPVVASLVSLVATVVGLVRCTLFREGVERLVREELSSIQELAVTIYPFYRYVRPNFSLSRPYTTVS